MGGSHSSFAYHALTHGSGIDYKIDVGSPPSRGGWILAGLLTIGLVLTSVFAFVTVVQAKSQSSTDFDGEVYLLTHINPRTDGDTIFQSVNPDNGASYPVWNVKLSPARDLIVSDLPAGVIFTQTGLGMYQLNATPFDGNLWLSAHGASADMVFQMGSTWLYSGNLKDVGSNSLPSGVTLSNVAGIYFLDASNR